jgi:hypothetical protein
VALFKTSAVVAMNLEAVEVAMEAEVELAEVTMVASIHFMALRIKDCNMIPNRII